MFKKSLIYCSTVLMLATLACAFTGGDGTADNPYQISTKADLEAVNSNLAANYILTNDIDLAGTTYTKAVIAASTGTDSNFLGTKFTGSFNGNSFKIKNLKISAVGKNFIGLFGYTNTNAVISNICITGGSVSGLNYVGGLVGENDGFNINCYSTGSVSGTGRNVGGLVGWNIGSNTNCYNTGSVSGTNYYVGGLVGENDGSNTNCYSTANVSGIGSYVGGLVGWNDGGNTNCYSTGIVNGNFYVGGLLGYDKGCNINCFWDTQTSGKTLGVGSGSSTGITGKTTAQMKTRSTFTGWDFADSEADGLHDAWYMSENGYPELYVFSNSYQPRTLQGDGTAQSPYLIYDKYDLIAVNQVNTSNCKLMADIDLLGAQFVGVPVIFYFTGTFDGNGYSVRNLTITGNSSQIGLFGITASGAIIKNLGIEECNISGNQYIGGLVGYNNGRNKNCYSTGSLSGTSWYVGGLVGYNNGSNINCYSTGNVSGTNYYVGGLVGYNNGSNANCYSTGRVNGISYVGGLVGSAYSRSSNTNCYSTGSVNGTDYAVGGLVGENNGSNANCYSTGSVSGTGRNVGGLVGSAYSRSSNTNCYSTGSVNGINYVGGLVGYNSGSNANCYSTGSVSGTSDNIGGLVGYNNGNNANCFWDMQTSGKTTSAGGTGKTTAQMNDINTFLTAGWDFVIETANGRMDLWYIFSGEYPKLYWQTIKGDINYDGAVTQSDLRIMTLQWLSLPQQGQRLTADIDYNGVVDLSDYCVLASQWQSGN